MDKNAVDATVGLSAIGILLAFYGFNTYNPDGNPAVTLDTTETSAKNLAKTSPKNPVEPLPPDNVVMRKILTSNISDLKSHLSLLEGDKTDQPLSAKKSKKVTLEVNDADENAEKIREDAKQEVAKETNVWSTFWKNEYDKQKDGDGVDEF